MEQKTVVKISFGSFVKFCSIAFFALGVAVGVLAFLVSLAGGDVTAYAGSFQLTGIAAGVASLFLSPLIFYLMGLLASLLAYLPFTLFLKMIRGLNLKAEFEKSQA